MKKLFLLLTLLLPACAAQHDVEIDGFSSPHFQSNLVHAIMPTSEAQKGDLQFAEASLQASRAISAAGISLNNDTKQPDIAIFLDYGISNPQKSTSIVSNPVYGQTGVVSSYGAGMTTYRPTYGVIGYNSEAVTTTSYTRSLALTAVDYRKYQINKSLEQVWKISVTSTGPSSDLRTMIPIMLDAAVPYIGKSTGRQVSVTISEDDPSIAFIRSGQLPKQAQ